MKLCDIAFWSFRLAATVNVSGLWFAPSKSGHATLGQQYRARKQAADR